MLSRLLYPFAWVRVRLPKWHRPRSRAWATAKVVATYRRNQKAFEREYGDLQGYIDTLIHDESLAEDEDEHEHNYTIKVTDKAWQCECGAIAASMG